MFKTVDFIFTPFNAAITLVYSSSIVQHDKKPLCLYNANPRVWLKGTP